MPKGLTTQKTMYIIGKEESNQKEKAMSNDFVYDMSQINEEEIYKGWEEMANEEGEVFLVGYGIPGDEADEEDGYDEDFWEEQYFG